MTRPLLAIFPHPDDETFPTAGVMAAAVERGIPVTVISATRGEAGESSIPGLDDPNQLGAVREQELREAMRRIGVTDVRLLGYRDSGMEGSPAAEHPRAFTQIPIDQVAAELVPYIRSIRPAVTLTFGPEGLYGHPDHIHLHHAVLRAITAAADPAHALGAGDPWQTPHGYFPAFPREEMLALLNRPDSPLASISPEARANLGVPFAEITHTVDITSWAEAKRAAIAAHRTQIGEGVRLPACHRRCGNGSLPASTSSAPRSPGPRPATKMTSSPPSQWSGREADLPKPEPPGLVPRAQRPFHPTGVASRRAREASLRGRSLSSPPAVRQTRMHDFVTDPIAPPVSAETDAVLFMWRGGGIILFGEHENGRWVLARAWLQGDRLEHVRRWSFAEPIPFSGQVRRLVMEAGGDAAAARGEGLRALAWTEAVS